MFKPHLEDVTATAVIEGLAVAKYDRAKSLWNVVFLRNCGHYPRLTIREVDRQSGRVIAAIRKPHEIKKDNSISITVASPAGNIPWKFVTDGAFDRKKPDHNAQDFRWMLDMQELSGREVSRTGDVPTNSLSIANGCFYTSVRTKKPYRKRWIYPDGRHTPIETIGLTGRTFGSDSKGDSVTIEVTGEDGFRETLEHRKDSRYEIIFDNTCVDERQPSPDETDFHFYYLLFNDDEGRVEILTPEISKDTGGGGSLSLEGGDGNGDTDPEPEPEPKYPACHSIGDGNEGN
jgi:hypothetical protein